jgi:cation-transporting ATPase 13A2
LLLALVPPGLIISLSVGNFYGASQLAKIGVILESPSMMSAAGRMQFLLFDKTGTLTDIDVKLVHAFLGLNQNPTDKEDGKLTELDSLSSKMQESDEVYNLMFNFSSNHTLAFVDNDIMGDPIEEELFDYAEADIDEGEFKPHPEKKDELADSEINSVIVPYKGSTLKLTMVKVFGFVPELQRMGVVVRTEETGQMYFFVKGSPEKVMKLCRKQTVSASAHELVDRQAKRGIRIIAFAYKKLDSGKYSDAKRTDLESELIFQGLATFDNNLKKGTKGCIQRFRMNNFSVGMITGDNIHTATAVAQSAGILSSKEVPWNYTFTDGRLYKKNLATEELVKVNDIQKPKKYQNMRLMMSSDDPKNVGVIDNVNLQLIIDKFKYNDPKTFIDAKDATVIELVTRVKVFARMNPEQKGIIVRLFKAFYHMFDVYIGYCGDGANDVLALKEADVGVSLSEDESSMSAPFLSFIPDITCMEYVSMAGKASLISGFNLFKYFFIVTVSTAIGLLILLGNRLEISQGVYLVIDFLVVMNLANALSFMPSVGKLTKDFPRAGLFNASFVISIIYHLVVCTCFMIGAVALLIQDANYENPKDSMDREVEAGPAVVPYIFGASDAIYYTKSHQLFVGLF